MDNQNQNNQNQIPTEPAQTPPVNQTTAAGNIPPPESPASPPPASPPGSPTTPSPVITNESTPTYVLFLIGAVVIVIVIIGLVFYFGSQTKTPPIPQPLPTTAVVQPTTQVQISVEPTLSSSDDLNTLEKEASSTSVNDMTQDDAQIGQELQGL